MTALLEIRSLRTEIRTSRGPVTAVDGISLEVDAGRTLGLVGESGCGKSMTALSVMGLLAPGVRIASGQVLLAGEDLVAASDERLRSLRGDRVAMIFQEPMTSLNPALRVGDQIAEPRVVHRRESWKQARQVAVQLLARVGIPDAADRASAFPHELSGGMRQRVMIAMALACDPAVLIADEPTTALDVTVQAQILELLKVEQHARQMALVLITHDLGVVAETCDDVAVMYAGRIIERASTRALFERPAHPYTAALLRSMPVLHPAKLETDRSSRRLISIPGTVPALDRLPTGCHFRDRCERPLEKCVTVDPPLERMPDGRISACHNPVPSERA